MREEEPRGSSEEVGRSDPYSGGEAGPGPAADPMRPIRRQIAESVGAELMAIHRDSYGSPAQRAETHFVGDTLVVILDGLELLPSEELLIGEGMREPVQRMRDDYQRAIEPTFRAAVERSTGRTVIGFSSHNQLADEPRFATEVFRLAPE